MNSLVGKLVLLGEAAVLSWGPGNTCLGPLGKDSASSFLNAALPIDKACALNTPWSLRKILTVAF